MDGVNWGGNREGAGRVSVVKRKYRHYYLTDEENALEQEIIAAFKHAESALNQEISKALKCKQYEIAEEVYNELLAARQRIVEAAIVSISLEKEAIKKAILQRKQP